MTKIEHSNQARTAHKKHNERIAEIEQKARDFLEYEHKRKTVVGIPPPNAHQYYEAMDHIRALLTRQVVITPK